MVDDPSSFDYLGHIRLLTFSARTSIFPISSEQAFISKLAEEPTEYTESFELWTFMMLRTTDALNVAAAVAAILGTQLRNIS